MRVSVLSTFALGMGLGVSVFTTAVLAAPPSSTIAVRSKPEGIADVFAPQGTQPCTPPSADVDGEKSPAAWPPLCQPSEDHGGGSCNTLTGRHCEYDEYQEYWCSAVGCVPLHARQSHIGCDYIARADSQCGRYLHECAAEGYGNETCHAMLCGSSEDADALFNSKGVQNGMTREAFRDAFKKIRFETGPGWDDAAKMKCRDSREAFLKESGQPCVNWCDAGAKMGPPFEGPHPPKPPMV